MPERTVRFPGRILFLTEDPALIRRQLAGEDLAVDPSIPLRDNISTDEITPGWVCYYYDETLGALPVVGLTAAENNRSRRDDVKAAASASCVSRQAPREGVLPRAAPYAERCAGVRLVIAGSIEQIYRQNCQNIGLLTTTDFGLLERIRRGEAIPISEFTERRGCDHARRSSSAAGSSPYNVARLAGEVTPPTPSTPPGPMTLAEKILARHVVVDAATGRLGVPAVPPGDAGFVRHRRALLPRVRHADGRVVLRGGSRPGRDGHRPGDVFSFRDHLTFLEVRHAPRPRRRGPPRCRKRARDRAGGLLAAGRASSSTARSNASGGLGGDLPQQGHRGLALPGQVVVGTDSHTLHGGALGCFAFGVGSTDMANAWITRDVRVTVPESVRFEIRGEKPAGVTAKDVMLHAPRPAVRQGGRGHRQGARVRRRWRRALWVDERATLTNMAVEAGLHRDHRGRRGPSSTSSSSAGCRGRTPNVFAMGSPPIRMPAGRKPSTSTPRRSADGRDAGRPGQRGAPLRARRDVTIDIAYGGSCTGGKKADMDMYAAVCADAVREGRKVAEGVTSTSSSARRTSAATPRRRATSRLREGGRRRRSTRRAAPASRRVPAFRPARTR